MQDKLLIVYNACGVSGRENCDYYLHAVNSIFQQQNFDKYEVVFSGCMLSPYVKRVVLDNLKGKVHINFIDELHPVNVTLNHSVRETVKRRGEFLAYMYVDSGTSFESCPNGLSILYKLIKTGKYGMVSPQPQNDTEYFRGLKVGGFYGDDETARRILFANGDYTIPVGRAFATHTNVVHNDLLQFYGRMYPDIFASQCTESVFSFLNAALNKQWLLVKDVMFNHNKSLDGPSSGFNPGAWRAISGRPSYDHPYMIPSIMERVDNPTARSLGLGYEECQNIVMHDESQFDENYHCVNDELKHYIKDNLFLKTEELNYDEINHQFFAKED